MFRRRPERRPPCPSRELAPVDLIRLHAGSDARFLRAAIESGARAIVLEGPVAATRTSRSLEGVREAVAAGVASSSARAASRAASSRSTGAAAAAISPRPARVFAGDLAGPKARVLFQLATVGDAAGVRRRGRDPRPCSPGAVRAP